MIIAVYSTRTMNLFTRLLKSTPLYRRQDRNIKWYKSYSHTLYENWKIQCEKNKELEEKLKNEKRKNKENNRKVK